MPIARRYSLSETLDALQAYHKKTGRRLIFEYILIRGWNDGPADLAALEERLKPLSCHINLIPYNDAGRGNFQSPSKKEVYGFLAALERRGLSATVRRTLGQDIDGACGQLRARHMET